ncbi:MAG: hypothetical protein EOP34_03030 [Rickettsiales bacterium]|nr:MAG: hypothetical protein EOP34_03030 [Rickettsiales bacterium]
MVGNCIKCYNDQTTILCVHHRIKNEGEKVLEQMKLIPKEQRNWEYLKRNLIYLIEKYKMYDILSWLKYILMIDMDKDKIITTDMNILVTIFDNLENKCSFMIVITIIFPCILRAADDITKKENNPMDIQIVQSCYRHISSIKKKYASMSYSMDHNLLVSLIVLSEVYWGIEIHKDSSPVDTIKNRIIKKIDIEFNYPDHDIFKFIYFKVKYGPKTEVFGKQEIMLKSNANKYIQNNTNILNQMIEYVTLSNGTKKNFTLTYSDLLGQVPADFWYDTESTRFYADICISNKIGIDTRTKKWRCCNRDELDEGCIIEENNHEYFKPAAPVSLYQTLFYDSHTSMDNYEIHEYMDLNSDFKKLFSYIYIYIYIINVNKKKIIIV